MPNRVKTDGEEVRGQLDPTFLVQSLSIVYTSSRIDDYNHQSFFHSEEFQSFGFDTSKY